MSNNIITKEALASGLKHLLEQQPLSKISVKHITEHCNISRNTFYYHFNDKYALIHWIFYTDMLANVNSFNDSSKLTESYVNVCRCLHTNRKFYLACFQYTGQNSLFTYIYDLYYELWKININMIYCQHGFKMTENEINLTARLKAHSLVGIISDWVSEGMRDNYMTFFEQVRDILDSEASSYSLLSNERMLGTRLEEDIQKDTRRSGAKKVC